jgi:5-methylcytosine-specific restriction endonuclease McrA
MSKKEYHAYLRSPEWKEKREQVLTRDGHKCRLCNSPKAPSVHHRRYLDNHEEEPLEDLITLCSRCHNIFHKSRGIVKEQNKAKDPVDAKIKKMLRKQKKLLAKIDNKRWHKPEGSTIEECNSLTDQWKQACER